jgi:hypothetical protein
MEEVVLLRFSLGRPPPPPRALRRKPTAAADARRDAHQPWEAALICERISSLSFLR